MTRKQLCARFHNNDMIVHKSIRNQGLLQFLEYVLISCDYDMNVSKCFIPPPVMWSPTQLQAEHTIALW